jgi:hypothetical protein
VFGGDVQAVLEQHEIPEAQTIILQATTELVEAKEAHEFKLLEEAKGRQVPRRNWAGGDAEAEKLEQAALAYLAQKFSADEVRAKQLGALSLSPHTTSLCPACRVGE